MKLKIARCFPTYVLIAALSLISLTSWALAEAADTNSSNPPPPDMCKLSPCQYNLQVKVTKKDGTTFSKLFDILPGAVQPNWLAIIAGQSMNFEAEVKDGKLTNYKLVGDVTDPQKTISVRLFQDENGHMILTVTNPFENAIKFDMAIMPLDSDRLKKTSSCPIVPKGSSYEMWPEPLFQVVLLKGRTLETSDRMVCASF